MTLEQRLQAGGWKRLDGIDLLRGLAIFFVLMNHVNMRLIIAGVPYLAGVPKQLAASLVWNGQRGVHMFFAISGFLITSITLRRWGTLSDIDLKSFYRLRFARIAPLLLALLAILSALHFAGVNHYVVSARTGGLWRALLAALTFHLNVLEAHRGYLPGSWDVLWSLSVEEVFYLFFPLLCLLLRGEKLLVPALLGFVVLGPLARTAFAHGNDLWSDYSYLGGMDAIALGCLTALLVARRRFSPTTLWTIGAAGTAILVFSLGFTTHFQDWGMERYGISDTILALGTCLFIMAAAQTEWKSPRVLAPLLHMGQNSYEIYLTHMFVVFAFFDLFVWTGKRMVLVPVLFVSAIVVSALAGSCLARFYSEPTNRYLRCGRAAEPENPASTPEPEEAVTSAV